jgi:hypothetical protein
METGLLTSGLIGLAANAILALTAAFLIWFKVIPVLLKGWPGWIVFAFLLVISLAEIPLMVFGLSKIAAGGDRRAVRIVAVTNALFVFFAAIYGAPVILLTGRVAAGLALCALGLLRLLSALAFVKLPKNLTEAADSN